MTRKDAFAAQCLALLRTHAGQQAEVVLLQRLLPAASLEFALGAVPVQNEIGWCRAGQQRSDFLQALSHFAREDRGLHFEHGVGVAVNDFAEALGAASCPDATRVAHVSTATR